MSRFKRSPTLIVLACISLLLSTRETVQAGDGKIVVANRGSSTITVIDAKSDNVIATVALPAGNNSPDPMYVVNTPAQNRVWVGDRANDRVVVYGGNNFQVEGAVPCGAGVFHMWASNVGRQLWVVNDIDFTVTVIDTVNLDVITTIDMPLDLVSDGAKPHDVVVDPQGSFGYVTFLDTSDPVTDTVVQFETTTFLEVGRALVGEDPHVSFNRMTNEIYLPCQGSNAVFVLDATSLAINDLIPVPGAHGAATSTNAQQFYTTNLPGSGLDAVVCIDTKSNAVVGFADAPSPVPHNLALTPNGAKLYVTHSGAVNNTVSVLRTDKNGDPVFIKTIVVGFNPFGLSHVR